MQFPSQNRSFSKFEAPDVLIYCSVLLNVLLTFNSQAVNSEEKTHGHTDACHLVGRVPELEAMETSFGGPVLWSSTKNVLFGSIHFQDPGSQRLKFLNWQKLGPWMEVKTRLGLQRLRQISILVILYEFNSRSIFESQLRLRWNIEKIFHSCDKVALT